MALESNAQHIAIVFNGLIRSLKFTHENLKSHVFKPITDAGWTYDIYCHNFTLDTPYTNIRNSESAIWLDSDEYKLLGAKYYMTDNQSHIAETLNLPAYRTKGNPWPHSRSYQTLDNYILAQWSKSQITRLLENNIYTGLANYDQVWFIRSDVLFAKPIDPIKCLAKLNSSPANTDMNICIIPDFHHYNGYNDRLFIAKPILAIKYGTYFDQLLELSKTHKLHSETINKMFLTRYNTHVIVDSDIIFQRVRTNGEIDKRDINLLTSY